MLSIDMQFMLFDEEKLPFLTWHRSGRLTPWQIIGPFIRWSLGLCFAHTLQINCSLSSVSWSCLVHTSYRFMNEKYSNSRCDLCVYWQINMKHLGYGW